MEQGIDQVATFLTGFIFGYGFKELADILHSYSKRFQTKIKEGF